MTDWCILLPTPASATLRLFDSLTEAGFDVWTPIEHKRLQGKQETERSALLSGFLFGRVDRLIDLHDLLRAPVQIYRVWDSEKRRMVVKGHPRFRMLRNEDGYSLVRERDLAHLRKAEQRRKPRGEVKQRQIGDRVKLIEGACAGLRGTVVGVRSKKEVIVSFNGNGFIQNATVPMWILLDDGPCADGSVNVDTPPNEQARIAKAA